MSSQCTDVVGSHVQYESSEGWGGVDDVMDDPEERKVVFAALDSFYQYSRIAHYNTTHLRRQSFYALPQSHWQLLASPPFSYLDTLVAIDEAIDDNAELAMAIFKNGLESFGGSNTFGDPARQPLWKGTATSNDIEKARSTLRQFYRDWSKEGETERKACFEPVMIDLKGERASSGKDKMTVLVPGAGLGRFVFELCCDGFRTEGNEISYHQLLGSSYILNCCPEAEKHKLHPWVHSFSNHKHRSRQLQTIKIPDVHPGSVLEKLSETQIHRQPGDMSMSASDFICLYGDDNHKDAFDAVATVFFIDTSPNLIRYIQTIQNCLKTGGIWTNLGPLLWHFENNPPGSHSSTAITGDSIASTGIADPGSIELTDDEVVALVEKFGFKIEKRESGLHAGYIQDEQSMLQSTYRASHWVARKI